MLSPYDVMRMACAAAISTGELIARHTVCRGLILRFRDDGPCSASAKSSCALHPGRPLACRLYPLGLERDAHGFEFIALEPAPGSAGVYGNDGEVGDFLHRQEIGPYLKALEQYQALLPIFRARLESLTDFEKIEPAEFRRRAVREALAESNYDYNPLIDALFDADQCAGPSISLEQSVATHVRALEAQVRQEQAPLRVAAAAAMLAVSLGYSPAGAFPGALFATSGAAARPG